MYIYCICFCLFPVDVNHSGKKIGSINDYDPIGPGSARTPNKQANKQTQEWEETVPLDSKKNCKQKILLILKNLCYWN